MKQFNLNAVGSSRSFQPATYIIDAVSEQAARHILDEVLAQRCDPRTQDDFACGQAHLGRTAETDDGWTPPFRLVLETRRTEAIARGQCPKTLESFSGEEMTARLVYWPTGQSSLTTVRGLGLHINPSSLKLA
jgi:hypothetical protein